MAEQDNTGSRDLQVRLIPELAIPYLKADIFQACRVDQTFALSCFQLDYQAVAVAAIDPSSKEPTPAGLLTRIAMDEAAFRRLRDEVNRIAEVVGLK